MNKYEDLDFVNTIASQEHSKILKKALLLFSLIIVFLMYSFYWMYSSEIDELTRGEGKVIPSEKIQKIQSLDGGIILDIFVREGSVVKKGQALMKIDPIRFKASLEENKKKYNHFLITKIRLLAESNIDFSKKIPNLTFSRYLLEEEVSFTKGDQLLFNKRIEELKSTMLIFELQKQQNKQELVEIKSKKKYLLISLNIIKKEKETIRRLVERKSKSNLELLKIQKEFNAKRSELSAITLAIPRLVLSIKEITIKKEEKLKIFKAGVYNELQKINTEIKVYESRLITQKDKIDKTILFSPVDGIIKQINVSTLGGVIRSGEDLMEIVPNSKDLLVEAKIDPKDIAFINPNQEAIVKLTAYDFSIYGGLEGRIIEISADSIIDKDDPNNKSYYKVVIKTKKNYLRNNGINLPIIPGMVASIEIKTGKKTILDFILKPILKTKTNSLHER